ncbi:MAG: hypothetical protein AB7S44_04050 [Spirochaetales bacterium]
MTKKLINNKYIVLALLLIAFFTLFCGNLMLFNSSIKKVGAVDADNTSLIVSKISRDVSNSDTVLSDGYDYSITNLETPNAYDTVLTLSDGDFAMLNNNATDLAIPVVRDEEATMLKAENILVSFGNGGSLVTWLQVTALLNGEPISITDEIKTDTVNEQTVYSFTQILDLKTLKDIHSSVFPEQQGYYEYTFVYHYVDSLGIVSDQLEKTFSFWLLDENYYVNVDGNNIVPKMYNTEKIDRSLFEDTLIEENYFNFNNFDMTDTYGAGSNLLFPTLIYDASKYNVSYTKQLYGITTTITSSFQIVGGQGQISFYENGSATPFKTDTFAADIDGNYIYDGLTIEEIADYDFTFRYTYKVSDSEFVLGDTASLYYSLDNLVSDRANDVLLYVYGYQLYYSENNVDDAEFKSVANNLYTDYSDSNQNYIDNYNTTTWAPSVSYPYIVTSGTIARTNQAPVFLKYYGSLKYDSYYTTSRSFYNYYAGGVKTDNPADYVQYPYTNNTRFTQNGYYEVVIIYDFQKYHTTDSVTNDEEGENSASTILHMQTFAFKIANLPPTVSIVTNEATNIVSGTFTNDDYIIASWQVGGVFDVSPTAKLWRQSFDGYNPYTQSSLFNGTYDNVNGLTYTANQHITSSGHYTLQIFYGPSTSTSVIYRFTIDKDSITGFTVTGVLPSYDEYDNITYLKDTSADLTGDTVINTPFTLNWTSKSSGATITARYSFTSITEEEGFVTPTSPITSGDEEWVANGYQTSTTYNNLTYYRTTTTGTDVLNANSVLKTPSIYVFTLTDQAGNTYNYYNVLDDTKALIIQDPEQASAYNYVPTATTLTWGTHKAIKVAGSSNLSSIITSDSSLYQTDGSDYYLTIPIEEVKIYSTDIESATDLMGDSKEDHFLDDWHFVQGVNFETSVTYYTGLESGLPVGSLQGENIYITEVYDITSTTSQTDLSFDNTATNTLIVNLDRSQGTATTTGDIKNGVDNSSKLLYLQQGTNRQYLYFSFKNGVDEYEIESLVYDFYALNFEADSPNYPFSTTPSLTGVDLLANATYNPEEDCYKSEAINTMYSTDYGVETTMIGMYVIRRTYVGDPITGEINESETGDATIREYKYYIDRYDIIDQTDITPSGEETPYLIGKDVKIILGEIEGRTGQTFNSFLINTTKETVLETNLLPALIKIPQNKYSIVTEGIASDGLGSFDLQVTVTRQYLNPNGQYQYETITVLGMINGYIAVPSLYLKGIYRVTITDKTGYDGTFDGANSFSFSFEITNAKPDGEFYGTPYNGQDTSLENVNSTNEDNLKFMWTDPIDIYSAKIDADNITLTQQLKNSTTETIIYQKVDGVVVKNSYGFTVTTSAIGTILGSSTVRNSYSLQIFTDGSALALMEGYYKVYIQYEGLAAHYIYGTENFFSNNFSIYIDRTAPEYNLNRLITQDTYLTTTEKSTVKSLTSTLNTENYPFAINTSFAFQTADQTYPNRDTKEIYYRKYDKYESGESNLQSLVPTDDDYYNYEVQPTRPRFATSNPIYTKFSYSSTSSGSSFASRIGYASSTTNYYEIIEIDEAGNYTIYTIQLIFDNPAITGEKLINEETEETQIMSLTGNSNQTIDALGFTVTGITNKDEWYKLTILNQTTSTPVTTTFNHTPTTVDETLIEQINNIMSVITANGASYKLTLYSRAKTSIIFTYNAQGNALEPTFVDYENSFVITLPTETASTTIESFKVYKAIDGVIAETEQYRLYYDMNGLTINSTGLSGASYEFVAGEYRFAFIDNFNRTYSIPKIFGVEDIATVYYTGAAITQSGVTYTASDVRVVYQSQLYSLTILKNSVALTILPQYMIIDTNTGIVTVYLTNIASEYGLQDNYSVVLTNSAGNSDETTFNFTVYTVIPTISLMDSVDNLLNSTLINGSTTKAVYISYVNNALFPFTATLQRDYETLSGASATQTYSSINPDTGYGDEGTYRLIFTNSLGVNKVFTWTVTTTETILYSVTVNINGISRILTPSTTKYSYGLYFIDQYFSIYDMTITLNPDQNLTKTLLQTINGTEIWRIYNSKYDRYIAITKVITNSSFISSSYTINSITATGSSYKTITNPTVITWQNYYLYEGNHVYVDYYYNGVYVNRTYDSSLTLTDPGIYNFKFGDFAGNTQIFSSKSYYEIVLINEVLFSVNDATPIEDIIFNDSVAIKVEHIDQYVTRSLSVAVKLNGVSVSPIKVNDYYIFTEYGVYTVTLSARVVVPEATDAQTITSVYTFTILNENEAKLTFEYSPQSGYELLTVVKDGVDVTDNFRSIYNSNTLTQIFISNAQGGNGHYTITVEANYLSLKPSQTFSFSTWVNNQTPIILSSIDAGTTTTKEITLTFNKYLIYQQIGDSVITINGVDKIIIDAETSADNTISSYLLSYNADYIVQLETAAGNTVLSFKVTKKAPLNTVSIILIIVGSIVVLVLGGVFINLRTRMKVS